MVFHQPLMAAAEYLSYLRCHHCGLQEAATKNCPSCQSPFLKQYGLGTQRVEQEVQKVFNQARIVRLDSDITVRRGALNEIFKQFAEGSADILIGTQMVSKGLDIPGVTVVGVLAADAAFNLPDYRSIERGFQLLTQVSGRAGRGDKAGHVVLQTYNTQMPALQWAKAHDFKAFAAEELSARQELGYPPFSQLIRIVVSGSEAMTVQATCEALSEELTHFLEDQLVPDALQILGPAPCLIERIKGKFRHHLLIKNFAQETGRALVVSFFRGKRLSPGLNLAIDVDALDLI
jgi:primosomal protein N' (replication factor Y)